MKTSQLWIVTGLMAGLLVSCGAKQDSNAHFSDEKASPSAPTSTAQEYGSTDADANGVYSNVQADSIASLMSSSAATGSPHMDTSHQFIRTADVRFRVKEVRTATFAIEKVAAHFGGYVAHTGLESTIDEERHTPVSDDSTLVTTYYTVHNDLTLRVPAQHLDSTLRTLGALVAYLDHRRIDVVDATLLTLRERLAARRVAHSTARLEDAVEDGQAKLRDRAAVEEALYHKQTLADESLLRTLELKDQIAFSTVRLQIYQRQAWTREMIANERNIDAYKPGFFHDAGKALRRGWEGLKYALLALLHIWPLVLVVVILVVGWRMFRKGKHG